ncbi:MAG: hypothetical protein ACI39H_06760, partial [Lachnospiraceae bacterium]
MKRVKILLGTVLTIICMVMFGSMDAKAEGLTEDAVSIFQEMHPYGLRMESIKNGKIVVEWNYQNYSRLEDENGIQIISIQGFELDLSTDPEFSEEKRTTYVLDSYQEDKSEYTYKIPVSVLGSNGKKLHVRIRTVGIIESVDGSTSESAMTSTGLKVGDKVYGEYVDGVCWNGINRYVNGEPYSMERREFDFVKINKTNFPGLYQLLKTGYYTCDKNGKKSYYDVNKDGWLDPSEIVQIGYLCNYKYAKYNGVYEKQFKQLSYQVRISGLKGLSHLPWVTALDLRDYTGTVMDLSAYKGISWVDLHELPTKRFKLVAPYAKKITVESEEGGSWKNASLKTIDVSKCSAVVDLKVSGSYFQKATVKLPTKAPNLMHLSIGYAKGSTLNVNRFTNLKVLEMYNIAASSLKTGSCKNLRYVYFWCDYNLRRVDLTNATKLVGVDLYDCPSLPKSAVKTVKTAKVTKGKGKWWYETKKYQTLLSE